MTKEEKAEYNAAYRERNRNQINATKRAHYATNSETILAAKAAYYAANLKKVRAAAAVYRAANRERIRAAKTAWKRNNPEKNRASQAAYRAANPKKVRAAAAACKQRNPHKIVAANHKRRAAKLKAIPRWAVATIAQCVERLARQRSSTQHIDHTVPLVGKLYGSHPIQLVCGLHAENNLQLISAAENLAKGCQEWPDMWDYTAGHMAELEPLCNTKPNIAVGMKAYV